MFARNAAWAIGAAAAAFAASGIFGFSPSSTDEKTELVDFAAVRTATTPAYNARLAPASPARVKEFRIPITNETIQIADGVTYEAWTFGGTVPGPTIRAREGDLVRVTLVNQSPIPHSIDFHSARVAPNEAYRTVAPGEEATFEFVASDPGVYVVHCGTPPVTLHLMQGMYLTMIVDPEGGWGTGADKEFVITQSEFYAVVHDNATRNVASDGSGPGPVATPDFRAAMDKRASYVTFNGKAFQYKANPLQVEVGDRVRFFVANAGPSFHSDFHVVGAVFDRVYPDGTPGNALESVQTWSVPAGGGAVFETVFQAGASGAGVYPFVTHAFADAERGAVGLIRVGSPRMAGGMSH